MEWAALWVAAYLLAGFAVAEFTSRWRAEDPPTLTGYVITVILWGILLPLVVVKLVFEAFRQRGDGE